MRSKSDLFISNKKSWYVNNSPRIDVLDAESILLLISHSLSRKSTYAEEEFGDVGCSDFRRCVFVHNSCRGDLQIPNLRVTFGSVFWTFVLLLIASTSLSPWWLIFGETDRSRGCRSLTSLKYLKRETSKFNIQFKEISCYILPLRNTALVNVRCRRHGGGKIPQNV